MGGVPLQARSRHWCGRRRRDGRGRVRRRGRSRGGRRGCIVVLLRLRGRWWVGGHRRRVGRRRCIVHRRRRRVIHGARRNVDPISVRTIIIVVGVIIGIRRRDADANAHGHAGLARRQAAITANSPQNAKMCFIFMISSILSIIGRRAGGTQLPLEVAAPPLAAEGRVVSGTQ